MTAGTRTLLATGFALAGATYVTRQCRKPTGWLGRVIVRLMNQSHSRLTLWGLQHVEVHPGDTVLDVGCGGGRTVERLVALTNPGKVCGIDYAEASVTASRSLNASAISVGRVAIQQATVSNLPYADRTFNLVTAVETHYYWPDHLQDLREIRRVLKPGGSVLLIAETFRGQRFDKVNGLAIKMLGGDHLSAAEHVELLANAGYVRPKAFVEESKGWICVTGQRPS